MEKEFVPYQEAIELKQLGFDEPCFGKWLSSLQSNWKDYELILEMGMNEEFEDNRNIYLLEVACSAPTYSQAFRWFREKYNLFGCIDLQACSPSHWFIRIDKIEINDYLYHSEDENVKYKTYEEAELACLQKLIELVKK
jgi:hypothetical protein